MRFRLDFRRSSMREVLDGRGVRNEVERRAKAVAREARGTAPVRTGAYRDSIIAEVVRTDRPVGRARATVPYAAAVEARHRTLGRSIDAARG